MTTIDIAGHLSFLIVAISIAMKDIIFLRILGICSGIVGIFYNYFVTSDPLWVPIIWLSIFIIINSSMISRFYLENTFAISRAFMSLLLLMFLYLLYGL